MRTPIVGTKCILPLTVAAAVALVGCDPTWATVVENAKDIPVLVRVETRPFNGDDKFVTDYVVAPGSRIKVGGNGVASVGQVTRVSLLDETCQVVTSDRIAGFDHGGVVRIERGDRLRMTAGGNPTADDEAITTQDCA
jgi:hypothetical protein